MGTGLGGGASVGNIIDYRDYVYVSSSIIYGNMELSISWGALDHAPQLMSCDYYVFSNTTLYTHTHTLYTANQETMVELVSFFQRSLPEELLAPPSRAATQASPTSSREDEDSDLNGNTEVLSTCSINVHMYTYM